MKLRRQKTSRLIGRCFLAGVFVFVGVGCDSSGNLYPSSQMAIGGAAAQHSALTDPSLTAIQSQSLGALGGLLGALAQQEAARESARQGRSEVNVIIPKQRDTNIQSSTQANTRIEKKYDLFLVRKGDSQEYLVGQVLEEDDSIFIIRNGEGRLVIEKENIIEYNREPYQNKKYDLFLVRIEDREEYLYAEILDEDDSAFFLRNDWGEFTLEKERVIEYNRKLYQNKKSNR